MGGKLFQYLDLVFLATRLQQRYKQPSNFIQQMTRVGKFEPRTSNGSFCYTEPMAFNFFKRNLISDDDNVLNDDSPAYFYFYCKADEKEKAEKLGTELEKMGYGKDVHFLKGEKGQFDDAWSITVSKKVNEFDKDLDEIEKEFRELAKKYQAEYDGHEVPV